MKIENLVGSDRHVFVTSGDWNKDGRKDILLGSRTGEIYAFENRADKGTDWHQIKFPSLQTAELSNGAKVVLAERKNIPLVEITIQFDFGYAQEDADQIIVNTFNIGVYIGVVTTTLNTPLYCSYRFLRPRLFKNI